MSNEREERVTDRFPMASAPTAYAAAFCPRCGTETGTKFVDGKDRVWCPECDVVHFRAAVPVIGVAVVDDDSVLGFYHDRTGLWDLPSGHQELPATDSECEPERARETAARELEEETNLAVDPDDLTVFDVTVKKHPLGRYNFSTTYRTTIDATSGEIEPEFETDEVAWFSVEEARAREDEFVPGVVPLIERAIEHPGG